MNNIENIAKNEAVNWGTLAINIDKNFQENTSSINTINQQLPNKLDKTEAAQKYQSKGEYALKSDLNSLATKQELTQGLSGKVNTDAISNFITKQVNDLVNYYNKTESDSKFATKTELGNINTILDNINGEVI